MIKFSLLCLATILGINMTVNTTRSDSHIDGSNKSGCWPRDRPDESKAVREPAGRDAEYHLQSELWCLRKLFCPEMMFDIVNWSFLCSYVPLQLWWFPDVPGSEKEEKSELRLWGLLWRLQVNILARFPVQGLMRCSRRPMAKRGLAMACCNNPCSMQDLRGFC